MKSPNIFQVRRFVMRDRRIGSLTLRAIVYEILNFDGGMSRGTIECSKNHLAEDLGCSRKTVCQAVKVAEQLGYWKQAQRKTKINRYAPTTFEIDWEIIHGWIPASRGSSRPMENYRGTLTSDSVGHSGHCAVGTVGAERERSSLIPTPKEKRERIRPDRVQTSSDLVFEIEEKTKNPSVQESSTTKKSVAAPTAVKVPMPRCKYCKSQCIPSHLRKGGCPECRQGEY